MLVYVCIVVVVRFTFCPLGKVDGKIRPLLFDGEKLLPFWLNSLGFLMGYGIFLLAKQQCERRRVKA